MALPELEAPAAAEAAAAVEAWGGDGGAVTAASSAANEACRSRRSSACGRVSATRAENSTALRAAGGGEGSSMRIVTTPNSTKSAYIF